MGCVLWTNASCSRWRDYCRLLRLDKPIGILLLLWPTLWGLWIAARGFPPVPVLCVFVMGVVLMRSAGCAVNDYADRDFDRHVERTKNRPVTSGRVSPREALCLAAGLSVLAFLITLPLGWHVVLMSIPAAFLAGSYPFTKRFFPMPQAYLGVAFGFGIPMAYVALIGDVPFEAWLLMLANVFWTLAYDTEYALVDKPDDLKIGIRTSAVTLGRFDVAGVAVFYALSLMCWVGLAVLLNLGAVFFLALGLVLMCMFYHLVLIRQRDRQRCFKAFLHNNWIGAILFAGLVLSYWPAD